ncbi:MAG: hypothetical protein AAF740_11190 [Bacteroidota bacterium]
MKPLLLTTLVILLGFFSSAFGQGNSISFSESSITPFVYSFEQEGDRFSGEGLQKLKAKLEGVQFVVLGETHGSARLSELTKTLLTDLQEQDFRYFTLEVGPHSGELLNDFARTPETTKAKLTGFSRKYYNTHAEMYPIPFFEGEEDADFLSEAGRLGFELWGLDQEFYTATPHLMDQLYENTPKNAALDQLKKELDVVLDSAYYHDENTRGYSLEKQLPEEATVKQFFEAVAINAENEAIIQDIKKSWEIYRWNQERKPSHMSRVAYMRQNFIRNYQKAKEKEAKPKVFLKTGRFHAGRMEQLDAYDLGNLVVELAEKEKTNSLHIGLLRGFYQREDGQLVNYWDRKKEYTEFSFDVFAQKGQWILIDTQQIREDWKAGKLSLPSDYSYHTTRKLLTNFDVLLIPPLDHAQTLLLEKGE